MEKNNRVLPLWVARLIVGFFQHTLTEEEKDQLDEWICINDENVKIFEGCLEITLRSKQPDSDMNYEENELRYIIDLIIKHLKRTITPEEKQILEDWIELSDQNK